MGLQNKRNGPVAPHGFVAAAYFWQVLIVLLMTADTGNKD
jgi:hypothetical protein